MNLFPNASCGYRTPVKLTDNAVSDKKNISFESAMVNMGSLVTYLAAAAVKRTAFFLKKAAVKAVSSAAPMKSLALSIKQIGKIKTAARRTKEKFADSRTGKGTVSSAFRYG